MLDELPARPPALCRFDQQPPAGSWDLQVYPPAAFGAFMAATTAPESPRFYSRHQVAVRPARLAVDAELPDVAQASWSHLNVPWLDRGWPHLHIALAATHVDGRPVTHDEIARAGQAAWIAYADRLIDYTIERDHVPWTRDGIDGVDDAWVEVGRPCPWLDSVTVVVASA